MAPDENRTDVATWVVGTDGSDHARVAAEWSVALAADSPKPVHLQICAAWQIPYMGALPIPGETLQTVAAETEAAIAAQARDLADALGSPPCVTTGVRTGKGPAGQVLLTAAEQADLVVVGSRGRGGFARLLLGSTSHQVAVHSPAPVIIVPPSARYEGLRRVIVGVDGSTNSQAALAWANNMAPEEAELVAAMVWESPAYLGLEGLDPGALDRLMANAEHGFQTTMDDAEGHLGCPGRFTRLFEVGHPGHALVTLGEDADLVVVGGRGRGGIAGAVLGSVATWVTHHLTCPAAVIPAPASTE